MTNIYLELELSLDPPITETGEFKTELNRKIMEWSKLAAADAKYQMLLGKAQTYLSSLPGNLQSQATDAKNTQLKKLREEIHHLGSNGGLMQFEVQYLIKTYSCFRERMVQEEIKKHSQNLIDGSGVLTTANYNASPVMETFTATFDKIRTNLPKGASKTVGAGVLAVLLIGVALYFVKSVPNILSGFSFPSFSRESYQRGVNPYIVRYANSDYTGKEWERVDTSGVNFIGDRITGWDKDNFSVFNYDASTRFFSFKDGQWTQNDVERSDGRRDVHGLFYPGPDTLYAWDERGGMRIFEKYSYRDINGVPMNPQVLLFLQNDEWLFVRGGNYSRFYQEHITEISRQDVLKRFGQFFVDNHAHMGRSFFFRPHHGIAVGKGNQILKCENDMWSTHYQTTHSGNVSTLWALDFENFVMIGADITVFRDGKESHPLIESGQFSFDRNNCWAVWGNSMDRFWIMDNTGCVAEFLDGKAGRVVVPGNFNSIVARWISPEGVVFVISDRNLYKLE